jgi:hypothetical protein
MVALERRVLFVLQISLGSPALIGFKRLAWRLEPGLQPLTLSGEGGPLCWDLEKGRVGQSLGPTLFHLLWPEVK